MLAVAFLLLGSAADTQAQESKKVLTVDDYDRWKHINGAEISNDGQWFAYGLQPNGGDDTLYVKNLDGDQVYRIPVAEDAVFSDDSRYVSYMTTPDEETREKMEERNEPVHETAWLLNLDTGEKVQVKRAADMTFSEDGRWWAVHREKPEDDDSDHEGTDLILRDLQDGTVMNIGNVSEFAFNNRSDMLAWLVDAGGMTGNGLYLRNLETGALHTLDADSATYSELGWDDAGAPREEWDDKGRQLVALKGHEKDSLHHRINSVVHVGNLGGTPQKTVLDPGEMSGFPEGMVISENRSPSFSANGEYVHLGLNEQEIDIKADRDTLPNVDVFHWKDDRIQTVQEQQARWDRMFTWAATWDPGSGRFTRLTDEEMRDIQLSDHNRFAVGRNEEPYESDINWGVSPADLYRVDLETGERTLFANKVKRPVGYSPDGRYYLYQQVADADTSLMVYDLEEDEKTDISDAAPVSFMDTEHPYPHENPTYGEAGWTADGDHVIMNHKYDLWMLALDGSEAVNITQGLGEQDSIEFRYETLDPEEEWIDTSEPMLLAAFGDWTKKDGYYRLELGDEPEPLRYEDAAFGDVEKARDADRVVLTRETFVEFPDYHLTDTDFSSLRQITDANPQQSEYRWGRRVLVEYTNDRGITLQGTLTLPAGYEEGDQVPMIVYFYEQMSDRHHQYSMPVYDDRPHMSTYASNGYAVLMPDNVYQTGRPGTSSLDCITAATQRVIDMGIADPDRIGLQGHSWGGYQSSFILTQTDMFATVVTGAPPTNLTSFYNNIYGSSGTNHHGIMEIGQVRMGRGVTPWSARETYNRENPMYHAPDIQVPFMILHGTEDGAVDYMQGLEFYNAARRLGKEVVLLTYPGEGHHLGREANQKDFLVRMKQWFDHYVKDEPAPEWIQEGVPYLDKIWLEAEGN